MELELLSWNQVVDITKDGGVIKKSTKESSDYKTATPESTVKVRSVPGTGACRLQQHGSKAAYSACSALLEGLS